MFIMRNLYYFDIRLFSCIDVDLQLLTFNWKSLAQKYFVILEYG